MCCGADKGEVWKGDEVPNRNLAIWFWFKILPRFAPDKCLNVRLFWRMHFHGARSQPNILVNKIVHRRISGRLWTRGESLNLGAKDCIHGELLWGWWWMLKCQQPLNYRRIGRKFIFGRKCVGLKYRTSSRHYDRASKIPPIMTYVMKKSVELESNLLTRFAERSSGSCQDAIESIGKNNSTSCGSCCWNNGFVCGEVVRGNIV